MGFELLFFISTVDNFIALLTLDGAVSFFIFLKLVTVLADDELAAAARKLEWHAIL